MPRPPLARERVLDAFETILIDDGERAATLDAVARRAEVSKGGLLYHFGSKEELEAGMIDRLLRLHADDLQVMATAPEGPVAYYIRTSVMEDDGLDRASSPPHDLPRAAQRRPLPRCARYVANGRRRSGLTCATR